MKTFHLFALLLTLPLLLGGCDRLSMIGKEPVAEAKPEVEGVNVEELERREDIAYLKGSDNPYTGKGYGLYKNGQKKSEGNWKNGKLHGLITEWYENGQKKTQGHFKDGKEDGLQTSWYESGQKKDEVNGKDGKFDGLWSEWYENGKKKLETTYKDDQKDGLYTIWYTNGQKMAEENFKDGKMDGLALYWHKNGQKGVEENYKDDKLVVSSAKYWNSKGEPVDSREEVEFEQ